MSKKVYVKPYPKEFREQVVKLVQLGDRSALEVAREFEISGGFGTALGAAGGALLDLLHLCPDRARIRRVAGEHIYGHGTAVGRAEQAEDDLLLALLAVAVVAERGQWRTAPLQIAGRDIVEQQGGALEMPSGEALLDPRLPPQQPVEHVEHFVAADGTEAEQGTEAAGGGLRGQAASGGCRRPPRGGDRPGRRGAWHGCRRRSGGGNLERLARVVRRMRLPSRWAWRKRMAGGCCGWG